jgi:signal transduction histidine kinase
MTRARILPLFGLAAVALLGVMGWLSATVGRLERAERVGREQAAVEESVRLALWRMDSLVAPFLVQEASLLPRPSPYVRLRFEWPADGRPRPLDERRAAEGRDAATGAAREQAGLDEMARWADRYDLLSKLPAEWLPSVPAEPIATKSQVVVDSVPKSKDIAGAEDPRQAQQKLLNMREFDARAKNVVTQQAAIPQEAQIPVSPSVPTGATGPPSRGAGAGVPQVAAGRLRPDAPSRLTALEPVWFGRELILARRAQVAGGETIQGVWLDWPGLREWLQGAVTDLLPGARLEPLPAGENNPSRRLASLPVRLVPGRPAVSVPPETSPLLLPLVAAWALAALALLSVGALLVGVATLGERRAAFVSAVTHELRTPLTTFRMYAEMLAEGMVEEESQRQEYLATLRREADRQSHLVENVLAYARLERGRYRAARDTVTLNALMTPLCDTLEAQAARSGMALVVSELGSVGEVRLLVDRSAVERIVFNLVDNACKYARDVSDRRIHLDWQVEERVVRLLVTDHGPGIAAAQARRLFRSFRKSSREAAQSAPGVGLGLALSRRLARALGGDLVFERPPGGGARFGLILPRA